MNAEARTGHVLAFRVYTGKIDTGPENKEVSHHIVMDLLNSFLDKSLWVFTDNYYSSPKLFLDLLDHASFAWPQVSSQTITYHYC